MGSTRRFSGKRRYSIAPRESDGMKVLSFDPARRTTQKQMSLPPKRPKKQIAPISTIRRAIWNAIAFLFGFSRADRSHGRGAQPSGKRRA